MGVLINWMGESFLGVCLSNHHIVHPKHLTVLLVHYTLTKLKKVLMLGAADSGSSGFGTEVSLP